MVDIRYGGKNGRRLTLVERPDYLVVRTQRNCPLSTVSLSEKARSPVAGLERIESFPHVGVEILRGRPAQVQIARAELKREPEIRFAGRVLCDKASKAPVSYTENAFIKFHDDVKAAICKKLLKRYRLTVKETLGYARNAFLVGGREGIGQGIFDVALELLDKSEVELSHPEVVRQISYRGAFPQQWYLKKTNINGQGIDAHASVVAAWAASEGEGTIIAIVDNGFDMDHEEFIGPDKIVAPRDVTRRTNNPRPGPGDNHGTACAGVACANGAFGAAGVAPRARLMPIRLRSGLGSQAEANAFVWAAEKGADVISCSWGPADGRWWDSSDPLHKQKVPLPDSTRLAIDFAIRNGRNGRGCVITWAAGNGNESVDNDGYASYEKVIAVTACNDQSRRSAYSDFGDASWCAFPSNDGIPSLTPGIWTTDRSGPVGYNPGNPSQGDPEGNYTNDFGGTSSACPGAAGVAALVLARNPNLRWDEVKDVLKRSAEKIDEANGDYDQSGHSQFYGYGRLNAKKAVTVAAPAVAKRVVTHAVREAIAVKDLKKSKQTLAVADDKPPKGIAVSIDIAHSFIGDLVVRLRSPQGSVVVLHDREGGGARDLKKTYDAINAPGLVALQARSPKGVWALEVEDKAKQDVGEISSFAIEFTY